ncbi:chloramphenicol acetyltransferase [Zeaxanthinibacter sp. PT1]|uniref:chloramphenicol acetyltransferase n=1 Tax=Zeaxanthinibacter TaxID=561554 RepID=UPI00234B436A|nr:chloramphenicol acetyltransferase [Zeaxanthinibacter sp. PT1]MDC6350445.1 chloramphenicol acetyltransferase [Zeaxanthinibacter sp. PT1]
MKKISFSNPHRKKHFDFFNAMNHPHFSITANVEVTRLLPYFKKESISVHTGLVYLLSKAANKVTEFRRRIRGEEVVEHQAVHPSFTVPTAATDVFSFCTVPYNPDPGIFLKEAAAHIEKMKTDPVMEDEPGRDDYLFLSAIPWIRFTAIQHAMHYHPHDSVPRISWGKIFNEGDKKLMPLSVQVHHALMDARHVGAFYENFEKFSAQPEAIFK